MNLQNSWNLTALNLTGNQLTNLLLPPDLGQLQTLDVGSIPNGQPAFQRGGDDVGTAVALQGDGKIIVG